MESNSHGPKASVTAIALVLFLVAATFAGNFLFIRVVVQVLPPLVVQTVRFSIAGAILFAIALPRSKAPRPTLAQWKRAAIAATLLVAIGQGCVSWAEQYIGAGIVVLLSCTIPIWVALLGAVFFRERAAPLTIAGIAIAFVGLVPLVLANGFTGHAAFAAIFVMVLSTISWAVGSLYTGRFAVHEDGLVATAMQLSCGAVLLFIATLASGEFGAIRLAALDATVVTGLVYLTLAGGVVAYAAYIWLLRNARPAVASTFVYLQAIIGVTLGAVLLREPVPPGVLAGGGAVIIGVGCVIASRR